MPAMSTDEPKDLGSIKSADGTRRVTFYQRSDGFFDYVEDTFFSDDCTEFGGGVMEYWTPVHSSGIYQTEQLAREAAAGELPWVKAVSG
jgi:hypothetical protein